MLPNSGDNVGFFRPLIEILKALEVCKILLLICGLREGDGNMFPGYPLVEIVFNLDSDSISCEEEYIYKKTYDCQDKGDGRQREHFILEKLRVCHAIIFFPSKPSLVDERLDDGCKEYSCFLLRVLVGVRPKIRKFKKRTVHAL